MTVLIVEDHKDLADTLQLGLEENGYFVDVVYNGIDGEVKARGGNYDILIVDWMMPGQNGPRLIKALRESGITTPVLMLTARTEKQDQIEALDGGADDYLPKPFQFEVLLARLRALARRSTMGNAEPARDLRLEVGPIRFDLRQHTVTMDSVPLDLRTKEYQFLMLLAEEPNRVLTRTVIAERVWGSMFITDDVVNTTVGSLRRKLNDAAKGKLPNRVEIETLRGIGYRLKVTGANGSRMAA